MRQTHLCLDLTSGPGIKKIHLGKPHRVHRPSVLMAPWRVATPGIPAMLGIPYVLFGSPKDLDNKATPSKARSSSVLTRLDLTQWNRSCNRRLASRAPGDTAVPRCIVPVPILVAFFFLEPHKRGPCLFNLPTCFVDSRNQKTGRERQTGCGIGKPGSTNQPLMQTLGAKSPCHPSGTHWLGAVGRCASPRTMGKSFVRSYLETGLPCNHLAWSCLKIEGPSKRRASSWLSCGFPFWHAQQQIHGLCRTCSIHLWGQGGLGQLP